MLFYAQEMITRIAHLSDPHINLKYHPSHLPRLRSLLRHALKEKKADHIIITGDLTSNADERDLLACRKLFEELDILHSNRLTLVIGNHDIFGGPHLADELLAFPGRCKVTAYKEKVQRFVEVFNECFTDTISVKKGVFPFIKLLDDTAILVLNSVAMYSNIKNPVGSNGEISTEDYKILEQLLQRDEVKGSRNRVVALHHHLFRRKDRSQFTHVPATNGLFDLIEQETLKLRGKKKLLKLLTKHNITAALHGHVHFTAEYQRKGIQCFNAAGAVFPLHSSMDLQYNLLHISKHGIENEVISKRINASNRSSNGIQSSSLTKNNIIKAPLGNG